MARSFSLFALALSLLTASLASAQVRLASPTARVHLEVGGDRLAPRDDRPARVGAEIGASFLTLGVGALVGGMIGYATSDGCSPGEWFCSPAISGFAGAMIGSAIAGAFIPLAVSGAGELNGGRGNVGAAYLGFLVGAGAGAGLIALGAIANDALHNDAGGWLLASSIAIGSLLTLAGPIVGYEAWDESARSSVRVTPTASASPDGFTLGANGSF